jgi:hypothetical protein
MFLMASIALIVLGVLWQAIARAHHGRLNKRQLVVADWEGLRITRTELIEGYRGRAIRHPLRGLTAWVEPDGKRVSVVVEGPGTSIVKISSIYNLPFMPAKVPSAQQFAAALNLARQQALN